MALENAVELDELKTKCSVTAGISMTFTEQNVERAVEVVRKGERQLEAARKPAHGL